MRNLLTIFVLFLCSAPMPKAQSLQNLSFGTDHTFEVATWNIEQFPKLAMLSVDSLTTTLRALDIDVLAVQEIDNQAYFGVLMDSLDGWNGYDLAISNGGLAYIYKTADVSVTAIYEIYTSYFREFPRPPLVMEMRFRGEDFVLINNHLKCCGDGFINAGDPWDEETRRLDASILLEQYIDANFPNDRVILLGDLNDRIEETAANNVFNVFLNDTANYRFADMGIASGSNSEWSFPSWPSHLDHILITNEVFAEFERDSSTTRTIKIDQYMAGGFNQYDQIISDHRPVVLKLVADSAMVGIPNVEVGPKLKVFPNPASGPVRIAFEQMDEAGELEIFSAHEKLLERIIIARGRSGIFLNTADLSSGIYYLRLRSDAGKNAFQKLIVIR